MIQVTPSLTLTVAEALNKINRDSVARLALTDNLLACVTNSIIWYWCKNEQGNSRLWERCGLPSIPLGVSSLLTQDHETLVCCWAVRAFLTWGHLIFKIYNSHVSQANIWSVISDTMVQPQMDRDRFSNVRNLDLVEPNRIRDSWYTPALDCYLLTFWCWKCHIHAPYRWPLFYHRQANTVEQSVWTASATGHHLRTVQTIVENVYVWLVGPWRPVSER